MVNMTCWKRGMVMGIARRLEKTRIVQNRERDKMVMKRIIENRIFRNLLSAVIFGLIYCVLSFIDKGNVKIGICLLPKR